MDILFTALGIVLLILFFINIKSVSEVLCRLTAGFLILMLYSPISNFFNLPHIGVNAVTAIITGILGLPGMFLLFTISYFL